MKNKTVIFFLACFMAASAAITVLAAYNNFFYNIVKPLLMPLLIVALSCSKTSGTNKGIVITGLLFSWAGDVLLLFEKEAALFFIGGLSCFLATHACYIIYFLKNRSGGRSLVRQQPWLASLVAAYGVSLVMFLAPHLGAMKIPVMVYAAVICLMVICSMHIFYKVKRMTAFLFLTGALLFTVSDSLLAVDKFYKPFAGAGSLIICTYCAAQLSIAAGAMMQQDQTDANRYADESIATQR